MKKARLLLLLIPVVAGLVYLRSLASSRPQTVYAQAGLISHLVFSSDGKTLLVAQTGAGANSIYGRLTALDTTHSFQPKWTITDAIDFGKPQFFANDTQILVDGWRVRTLDAATGKTRRDFELSQMRAAMSPNGRWLAHAKALDDSRITIQPLSTKPNKELEALVTKTLGSRDQGTGLFAFSPDSKRFAVTTQNSTGFHLQLYDTKTWKRTHLLDDARPEQQFGAFPAIYDTLQWSRDGQFFLSHWLAFEPRKSQDSLILWNARDASKRLHLKNVPIPGAALTLQNHDLLYGTALGTVETRRLADNYSKPNQLLAVQGDSVTAVALSRDGAHLFAGTQRGKIFSKLLK